MYAVQDELEITYGIYESQGYTKVSVVPNGQDVGIHVVFLTVKGEDDLLLGRIES